MDLQISKRLDEIQAGVMTELLNEIGMNHKKKLYVHMTTGSGKTNLAIHFIFKEFIQKGKRVLVLSHNWFLIEQFLLRMTELYPNFNYTKGTAFWAGQTNPSVTGLKSRGINSFQTSDPQIHPHVLFSSYQSLGRVVGSDRRESSFKKFASFKPDLIVIDEAHWGKNGKHERDLFNYFEKHHPDNLLIGLTATPKTRSGWGKVGNIYFSDLVEMGVLARPLPKVIPTESNVALRFDSSGMIVNESELYRDSRRNLFLVDNIIKYRERTGKTVVFAGDTEHADTLARMLRKRGVSVITIHSQDDNPSENLSSFKNGAYDVAVTVYMLSEGINIPDINTVVIARPVQSEIMFAQMVGRGCRMTKSKRTFTLLDFHDSTENEENQKHLFHYKDYYNLGADSKHRPQSGTARPRLRRHESDFTSKIETLIYDPKVDPSYYSVLHGLRIDAAQTFGVEFELSCPGVNIKDKGQWLKKANTLHASLIALLGKENVGPRPTFEHERVKEVDYGVWNVVYDGSCGFEIVTPILKGKEGFEDVVRFLKHLRLSGILDREGFKVDHKTGTHIHLGWKYKDAQKVQDILKLVYKYEGAFNSLISSSRVINQYCKPLRREFSPKQILSILKISDVRAHFGKFDHRYRSINLTKFNEVDSTIEIRSHNGTLNEKKILTWLALWMNCINSVERLKKEEITEIKKRSQLIPEVSEEDDVVSLCHSLFDLNVSNGPMLSSLHQRRLELLEAEGWKKAHGEEKISQLKSLWSKNFRKGHIVRFNKKCELSDKFHEEVYLYGALTEELKLKTAKKLISSNALKIAVPELMERLSKNLLLVRVVKGEFVSCVGLKETSGKYLESLKRARKLSPDVDLNHLRTKFEQGYAIEKGWSYNAGTSGVFKKMNRIVEDYFELLYPQEKGFFLFSTVVEGNEDGHRHLKNGRMQPGVRIKSPFSENTLVMYFKYFKDS